MATGYGFMRTFLKDARQMVAKLTFYGQQRQIQEFQAVKFVAFDGKRGFILFWQI
jgi:hypothetical protein